MITKQLITTAAPVIMSGGRIVSGVLADLGVHGTDPASPVGDLQDCLEIAHRASVAGAA